jgi:hypothetical protein
VSNNSDEKYTLLEMLSQFGTAKGHFVNSQREVLLGFREVCKVLTDLSEASGLGIAGDLPSYTFKAVGAVIDYFLSRVPENGKPEDVLAAKVKAIDELIEILEAETQRVGKTASSEVDLAKVEALISIKKYLMSERSEATNKSDKSDDDSRIRKVVIE